MGKVCTKCWKRLIALWDGVLQENKQRKVMEEKAEQRRRQKEAEQKRNSSEYS